MVEEMLSGAERARVVSPFFASFHCWFCVFGLCCFISLVSFCWILITKPCPLSFHITINATKVHARGTKERFVRVRVSSKWRGWQ